MGPSNAHVLGIVEAIYHEERSERAWIQGILAAARPALDEGCGLLALPFEASPSGVHAPWVKVLGTKKDVGAQVIATMMAMARNDHHVARAFRAEPCATSSELGFMDHPAWRLLIDRGVLDFIAICGVDTVGRGLLLGPLLRRVTCLAQPVRLRLQRVAGHLGVGLRYRRLKKTSHPAGVFSPGAKLLHAEGDASKPKARAALARAVVAIDRARSRQRRTDPDGALEAWKGLVAARWSLVDEFESDGRRYVVARENEPFSVPLRELSKRERQIVGYVALGHTTKLIAYELGISDSTVRVLLSRAMQRLKVNTREALAAKVQASALHVDVSRTRNG